VNAGNVAPALNVLIISAILVLNYFYQRNRFVFSLKCVCSSAFALLGVINLGFAIGMNQANLQFYILMATALVLAMLGDVFIGKSFILGAGLFALGHVSFIIAYFFLHGFSLREVWISAAIFAASAAFLIFAPCIKYSSDSFRWVCVAYALIISSMLGKALANLTFEPSGVNILIAVGSFLFFFSDLMLVLDWFVRKWKWTANACMGTYYPALCILAFSMYFKAF